MTAQTTLLRAARWQPLEFLFWALAFASPWLLAQHALIINEIAIVALFAVSLDLVLGYTGIVAGACGIFGFWCVLGSFVCQAHPS
jgi:branched-chain amino acid transport system permease protein